MSEELTQDDFEMWIFEMDDELDIFIKEASPQIKHKLDFSEKSLDGIEEWLLAKYKTTDEIMDESQKLLLDRVARYVGETIRKKYNLVWKIELERPDDAYFGLPVLTDKKGENNYECPLSLVTATVDRQEKGYLRMVFQSVML